jgi:hypothetical protein
VNLHYNPDPGANVLEVEIYEGVIFLDVEILSRGSRATWTDPGDPPEWRAVGGLVVTGSGHAMMSARVVKALASAFEDQIHDAVLDYIDSMETT